MKVFEACMFIVKRRISSFAIYFGVFIALSIVMTALSVEQLDTDFSTMKPKFTVINRDKTGPLSEGLISYLREHGEEVKIEDEKNALQDATFFHATDYIVFLPSGFEDKMLSGETPSLETVFTTETAKGYYADSLINRYCNLVRVYLTTHAGIEIEELVPSILRDLSQEAKVEKKQFGDSAPIGMSYLVFNRLQCYILMLLNILCVTNITMSLKRPDIMMRNLCTPLKPRSLAGQQMLCFGILSFLAWVLLAALGFAIYGSGLVGANVRSIALILLNSLVFSAVALSIAAFSSTFIRNPNSQNAAANMVSLGLCFLGGVFVPLDMLGEGILSVARFLPSYWYNTAIDSISALTSFGADAMSTVWRAMLIQLAFAAAFFCVTLTLGKQQSRSERFFGSVRTELEA